MKGHFLGLIFCAAEGLGNLFEKGLRRSIGEEVFQDQPQEITEEALFERGERMQGKRPLIAFFRYRDIDKGKLGLDSFCQKEGGPRQDSLDIRLEVFFQKREEFVADAVPEIESGFVAFV